MRFPSDNNLSTAYFVHIDSIVHIRSIANTASTACIVHTVRTLEHKNNIVACGNDHADMGRRESVRKQHQVSWKGNAPKRSCSR
jgi:hypothetical protein